MRCVLLNRNYPPGKGITGQSANELAGFLRDNGVDVHVITPGGAYAGGGCEVEAVGTVHRIPKVYDGKKKLLRLMSSLIEGYRMVKEAERLNISPWICMTDPPLLNFWAARCARRTKRLWAYWTMDLYPEAFVAAGLCRTSNFLYRYVKRVVEKYRANFLIALGPKQAAFIRGNNDRFSGTILPCGIETPSEPSSRPSWALERDKIRFAYAGNLGEAHSLDFLCAFLDALDPLKHRCLLALYGANADTAKAFARGNPAVVILDNLAKEHFPYIDVHLVSLKPEWNHICVPSKAVSSICQGGAILFHGSPTNDTWALLKDGAWLINADKELGPQIEKFLESLTVQAVQQRRSESEKVAQRLREMKGRAFEDILDFIRAVHREPARR